MIYCVCKEGRSHGPAYLWYKFAKYVEKDEDGGDNPQGDSCTVVEEDVSVVERGGEKTIGYTETVYGGGGQRECEKDECMEWEGETCPGNKEYEN